MASGLFTGVINVIRGKKDSRENVPISSLDKDGSVIGLYFSAHWCPPCRGFTPKLAEWYTNLTSGTLKDKLEIVFVSSDRDEDSFDEYFDSMPWLALPYSEREVKTSLSKKYKVQGIPTLVFVNAQTGELITKNGRSIVAEDTNGDRFPWIPETFNQLIANGSFINKDGGEITWEDCKDKTVGIYFSAHWCPPCRGFTPQLAKFYTQMKEKGKPFEVIFASSDNSEEEYKEYLGEMPWYSIPYEDKKKDKLDALFEVSGIPTLVIIEGNTGNVITSSGRGMVAMDPEGKDFPWHPKALEPLHGGKVDDVNERPCMIWFTDGTDAQIEEAKAAMNPVAEPYFEQNQTKEDSLCFMYSTSNSLAERLQGFIKISPPFPVLAIIEMSEQKKALCTTDPLSESAVKDFLKAYEDKSLIMTPFK